MQPEHGYAITGWASALPSTVVTNQDIMTLFDTSDEWIVERTGIRQRRAADGPFVHPKPARVPARRHGHDGPDGGRSRPRRPTHGRCHRRRHRPAGPVHDQPGPARPRHLLAPGPRPGHKGRRHGHKRGLRRLYLRAGHGGRLHCQRRPASPAHRGRDPDPHHQLGRTAPTPSCSGTAPAPSSWRRSRANRPCWAGTSVWTARCSPFSSPTTAGRG